MIRVGSLSSGFHNCEDFLLAVLMTDYSSILLMNSNPCIINYKKFYRCRYRYFYDFIIILSINILNDIQTSIIVLKYVHNFVKINGLSVYFSGRFEGYF